MERRNAAHEEAVLETAARKDREIEMLQSAAREIRAQLEHLQSHHEMNLREHSAEQDHQIAQMSDMIRGLRRELEVLRALKEDELLMAANAHESMNVTFAQRLLRFGMR